MKSLIALATIVLFSLCLTADAHAEGTPIHSFNNGQIVLSTVDLGFPNGSVTTCDVTNNGGLPSSQSLRMLDDWSSDDLSDPFTFLSGNLKYVIWKTTDENGDPHWWIACWRYGWLFGVDLLWSTEISHD